jgi:hypothetical protein
MARNLLQLERGAARGFDYMAVAVGTRFQSSAVGVQKWEVLGSNA